MEYKKFNNNILLRLDPGDEILDCIVKLAEQENIELAEISGIGATDNFKIGVFDTSKSKYDIFEYKGDHEITNLCGSITTMDGKKYQHLHITGTNQKGEIVGGHLLEANISLTAEIFVRVIDGKINRKHDDKLGINRWDFN